MSDNKGALLASLLYIGGFFLFLEWLRPLEILTESNQLTSFIAYAVFCFFVGILHTKRIVSFLLKVMALLFILDATFVVTSFGTAEWFHTIWSEITYNSAVIAEQNWYQLTPFFRGLMFLILIWLLSYLLYFWIVEMKRVFLFIVATFIFITVMDTFTAYQADHAIIRTFVVSLLMLSIASYLKRMKQAQLKPDFGKWVEAIFIPSVIMLAFFVFFSYQAPKLEPIWPDPVPFLISSADQLNDRGSEEGRVGYGENDTRLGGSFTDDDTPVFQAETSKRHYWRIESKDRYTGKGWTSSAYLNNQSQTGGTINLDMFAWTETADLDATVHYLPAVNFEKIVYPYGLYFLEQADTYYFSYNQNTGIVEPELSSDESLFNAIELNYAYPNFTSEQLRTLTGDVPSEIQADYLQLPNDLPDRVGELAEQITLDEETRYDQVVAIEGYFGQGDFTYQTNDVAIPADNQDYVDQFLFDTQVGYCDNFSTSMIVMLRTLGIPARWVKGFTSGEVIEDLSTVDQDRHLYEITNNNAHSWVEVYFPEIGWVPFEPTIGFAGEAVVTDDTDQNDGADSEEEDPISEEDRQEEQLNELEEDEEELAETNAGNSGRSGERNGMIFWVIIAIIGLALIGFLYVKRYRWLMQLVFWRYPAFKNAKALEKAYHYLLRIVVIKAVTRRSDQTLQEYALEVDAYLQTSDMSELTRLYQRVLYRNELALAEDSELHALWKKIIRQILS